MAHLSIDIETKSSIEIGKAGLYRYAQSPDFGILLFAYQMNEGPVEIIDLAQGEEIPRQVVEALQDPGITKHAYNAAFEWYCLNTAGYRTPLEQWRCTMAHSLYCGYPAGLDATGKAVGLPQDKQKLAAGKALIRYFCVPCKPTKNNGNRTWNLPKHAPEKWELFKGYCRQDVVAEHNILRRLEQFPMPEEEERLWQMDVRMNAFGVRVDEELTDGALYIDERSRQDLMGEAMGITGIDNPNSTVQLMEWLEKNGTETDNLPYLLSLRDVLLGRGERGFAFGDAVVIFSQLIYMAVLALFALDVVSAFRRGTWVRMLPFWGIFALACGIAVLTVGAPRYHMPYLPIFAMGAGDYLLAGRGGAGEPDKVA